MKFFDEYKINYYKNAKKVELQFLEPFDVIEESDVCDYDTVANLVVLGFDIKKRPNNLSMLTKNVVMPSGEITKLYSTYCSDFEPTFKVVGKAVKKTKTEQFIDTLTK